MIQTTLASPVVQVGQLGGTPGPPIVTFFQRDSHQAIIVIPPQGGGAQQGNGWRLRFGIGNPPDFAELPTEDIYQDPTAVITATYPYAFDAIRIQPIYGSAAGVTAPPATQLKVLGANDIAPTVTVDRSAYDARQAANQAAADRQAAQAEQSQLDKLITLITPTQ